MEHIRNPQNMGEMKDADGVGTAGNPVCVVPETLVLTNSKMTHIKNIKTGDRVISHDGLYHQVEKVYKRNYSGTLYSVRTHNLGEISLTPEHHILVLKMAHISHKFEAFQKGKALLDWFDASQLTRGDVILYPILKETHDKDNLKFEIPRSKWDFKSKDLPKEVKIDKKFLRLVGYFLAEGYTRTEKSKGTVGFVFGEHEEDFIADTVFLVKKVFGLEPSIVDTRHNSTHVVFYSARLARFFSKLFGKGAVHKRIPYWMMTLPLKKQEALLCGLWRGDGYIDEKRKTSKFVTVSRELAYGVRTLLLRQKMISSFLTTVEKGMHKRHYSLYVKEDRSLRKLAEIVGVKVNFTVKKKNPRKSWFNDNFYYVPIWKIGVSDYSGLVYNLEVAESASYVSNAAALHNCGDIMRLFIKVAKKDDEEVIEDIKFQTLGCGAAIATSSMVTTMIKGKSLSEAEKLSNQAVAGALGGLPPVKMHCSVLAADALKKAIDDYRAK